MASAAAREAAVDLVLAEMLQWHGDLWRFGVRVFPSLTVPQCYKKMLSLIHPDKNGGSSRSAEATRYLLELWDEYDRLGVGEDWFATMASHTRRMAMNSFELKLSRRRTSPSRLSCGMAAYLHGEMPILGVAPRSCSPWTRQSQSTSWTL